MMTLEAGWKVGEAELLVSYRLTNRHPTAVFAYTVPRTAARLQPFPGAAYTRLSKGDIDLTLLLGTCDPPAGVQVTVRVQPLAVRIPARQTHVDQVRLPVPVPEWNAYSLPADSGQGGRPVSVYLLRLEIEYVLEGETYFHRPTPDGTAWDVGGSPVRRVATTFVPDLPIPVIGNPLDGRGG